MIIHFLISIIVSSILYLYLHKKTRISLKYLYQDNIVVIILAALCSFCLEAALPLFIRPISFFLNPLIVIGIAFGFTMIRFWRTPKRKISALENELVSPADGNVIYISRVEAGNIPVSIKGANYSKLEELTKTDLLDKPCWMVGINMTPFDVHKNCAPIDGKIILNKHFKGKFLSLKDKDALVENERNSYVIQGDRIKIGVIQIASKLVKRIDSYVTQGDTVKQGDWLGMIRFGSQVDIIIPENCKILVRVGEQVYAGSTIIANHPVKP